MRSNVGSQAHNLMNATLRHEDVSFLSMVVEVQSFHIVPSHRARAELMKSKAAKITTRV